MFACHSHPSHASWGRHLLCTRVTGGRAIGKAGDSSSAIVLPKQHPDALCHIGFDGQMVMVQAGMDHLEAAGRRAA